MAHNITPSMTKADAKLHGVGLGLRREFIKNFCNNPPDNIDFLEVAPENWMRVGGARKEYLAQFMQQYPVICHGLSLSIGSPAPLDESFLQQLKVFLDQHNIALYSEHLSYCSDLQGQLYDLLPMPFTEEAVHYVAARVRRAQDILGRRIALENVSYYCSVDTRLSESEFINAVLSEADCDLLLDVNNVYVNSVNHRYDPIIFLKDMPKSRIAYLHIAGHYPLSNDLLIDTHGSEIIPPVFDLLAWVYEHLGVLPTLLERDNDVPDLFDLLEELEHVRSIQLNAEEVEPHE